MIGVLLLTRPGIKIVVISPTPRDAGPDVVDGVHRVLRESVGITHFFKRNCEALKYKVHDRDIRGLCWYPPEGCTPAYVPPPLQDQQRQLFLLMSAPNEIPPEMEKNQRDRILAMKSIWVLMVTPHRLPIPRELIQVLRTYLL